MTGQVESFQDFQKLVSEILQIDIDKVIPQAYFITDLGVDSIRMVEVLLRLEKMGVQLTPSLAWRIQTVQDAYLYYRQNLLQNGDGQELERKD